MSDQGQRDSAPDLPELDALDPVEEQRLRELLRCAIRPSEIDPARHERLLAAALEDPFAEPSAEELVESERLRQALDGQGDHEDARLARALSAAFTPSLDRPLAEPPLAAPTTRKATGRVLYYRFGAVATALAVAAAALLQLTPAARKSAPPVADLTTLALAQSRSTAAFFRADSAGAPSDRIDRIAAVRGRELRDNRYALWGVR